MKDLWEQCVCKSHGKDRCRFHYGKTITEGPHNELPWFPNVDLVELGRHALRVIAE